MTTFRQSVIWRNQTSVLSQGVSNFFSPIEFELQRHEGLMEVEGRDLNQIPKLRKLLPFSLQNLQQGAIQMFHPGNMQNENIVFQPTENELENVLSPLIAVCITVYNEPKDQLEATIQGVLENMPIFNENGIFSSEIVVIVIFDGIDKIKRSDDPSQDVLTYFEDLDWEFDISGEPQIPTNLNQNNYAQTLADYNQTRQQSINRRKGNTFTRYLDDRNQIRANQVAANEKQRTMESEYNNYKRNQKFAAIDLKTTTSKIWTTDKDFFPFQSQFNQTYQMERERVERDLQAADHQQGDPTTQRRILREAQQNLQARLDNLKEQVTSQLLVRIKEKGQQYIKNRENSGFCYQVFKGLSKQNISRLGTNNANFAGDAQTILLEQNGYLPIFLLAKYANKQKLSSHLWFFNGFCKYLKPKYTILLDCGLNPDKEAIFNLFCAMESDPTIGGVCGFMGLKPEMLTDELGQRTDGLDVEQLDYLSQFYHSVLNIQEAQVFEYNYAHIIDKAFESLFGFIHVLPGAFSGYRYEALDEFKYNEFFNVNDMNNFVPREIRDQKSTILQKYLKTVFGEKPKTIEEANMYLAEDRILCLEIYSRIGKRYNLKYIPNAKASVDPITSLSGMLGQRKRWINGSWFALDYVLAHQDQVFQSQHSLFDVFLFKISMYYAWFSKWLTYYVIAIYFSVLYMMISQAFLQIGRENLLNKRDYSSEYTSFFVFSYIIMVFSCIFLSLNYTANDPSAKSKFYFISTLLGIYMVFSFLYATVMLIMTIIQEIQGAAPIQKTLETIDKNQVRALIYIFAVSMGIPVLFNLRYAFELLYSLIHYIGFSPSYIHLFFIYAFCRIDDLSWGTKGDDSAGTQENLQQQYFQQRKLIFVSKWIVSNCVLSVVLAVLSYDDDSRNIIMLAIAYYSTGLVLIRCILAVVYYMHYYFFFLPASQICPGQRILFERRAKRKTMAFGAIYEFARKSGRPNILEQ